MSDLAYLERCEECATNKPECTCEQDEIQEDTTSMEEKFEATRRAIRKKNMQRHTMDNKTLVCSCGKTKEKHFSEELLVDKWRMKNEMGEVDLEQMVKELS